MMLVVVCLGQFRARRASVVAVQKLHTDVRMLRLNIRMMMMTMLMTMMMLSVASAGPRGLDWFQEGSGGTRRLQQDPRVSIVPQDALKRHQEAPGVSICTGRAEETPNWSQEVSGGPRRPQETPRARPGPASPAFRSMHHNGQHTVNSRSTRRSTRGQHNGQHPLKLINCLEHVDKHAPGSNK